MCICIYYVSYSNSEYNHTHTIHTPYTHTPCHNETHNDTHTQWHIHTHTMTHNDTQCQTQWRSQWHTHTHSDKHTMAHAIVHLCCCQFGLLCQGFPWAEEHYLHHLACNDIKQVSTSLFYTHHHITTTSLQHHNNYWWLLTFVVLNWSFLVSNEGLVCFVRAFQGWRDILVSVTWTKQSRYASQHKIQQHMIRRTHEFTCALVVTLWVARLA